MDQYEIKNIDINSLKQHEMVIECHLERILAEIKGDGCIKDPIIADKNTMVIVDGHHRYNALKRIGAKYCPVCLVDYKSNKIKVGCWRKGERVTKDQVISAGLSGNLFVPKTSKHEIPDRPLGINIPLDNLR